MLAERLPRHRTYYGIADGVNLAKTCERVQAMAAEGALEDLKSMAWGPRVITPSCGKTRRTRPTKSTEYGLGYKHAVYVVHREGSDIAAEDIGKLGKELGVNVVGYNVRGLQGMKN